MVSGSEGVLRGGSLRRRKGQAQDAGRDVRRDLSGGSQTVFDEVTELLVEIHISALVTGP